MEERDDDDEGKISGAMSISMKERAGRGRIEEDSSGFRDHGDLRQRGVDPAPLKRAKPARAAEKPQSHKY